MSTTFQPYKEVEADLAAYFRLEPAPASGGGPDDSLPPLAWAEAYRRIDDHPFTLDRFRPLAEIYDDDHPFIVIMKPAQVGVSEMAITRAVWALDVGARFWGTDKAGLNVGYLFPTQAALSDFSKERFSSLRTESDHLSSLITDYDDVGFKQAGESFLYLRGAWSSKALKSFPADVLVFDEFDEMAKAAVALAEKRLRASPVKRQLRLSTPTLPGLGVHGLYMQSDQRVWEVLCGACGRWNELDFFRDVRAEGEDWETWRLWEPESVRSARITVACPSCRKELDRCGEGRWTARRPEILGIRGYHVPALSFPSVSLTELAVTAVSTDPTVVTEFYRSDLGLPYEPAGSRVTDDMLRQLGAELQNGLLPSLGWRDTTMGVDVGARLHYRVSSRGSDGHLYVRAMGHVRAFDDLDQLMTTYRVRQCVIDALPELHKCQEWAARHKGKVLRAFYPTAAALKGELLRTDRDAGIIQINRTMAMDRVFNAVATAKERWPASIHRDPEVVAHMKAPVRVLTVDERGQEVASWEHTAPDHLFHASVYDLVARETLPRGVSESPSSATFESY